MMEVGRDIMDGMQKRQLIWSGHINRMDETTWPRKVLERVRQEKCKGGCREDAKEGTEAR
jgi:hypothetical protein